MSTADRQQAHYFDELLGSLQAELVERIQGLSAQVSKLDRIGDSSGISRTQRTIRTLEADVRGMDRMREALRLRLQILSVGA